MRSAGTPPSFTMQTKTSTQIALRNAKTWVTQELQRPRAQLGKLSHDMSPLSDWKGSRVENNGWAFVSAPRAGLIREPDAEMNRAIIEIG